jgi:hypothetical protein
VTTEGVTEICEEHRDPAVGIPRQFALPAEHAELPKNGGQLVIEPAAARSLLALLTTLQTIDEDFAPIDDPAPKTEL